MGAYTTGTAFVSATVTATTEDALWPAANVLSVTRPHRVFKSTAAAGTAQALVFDFGATTSLDAIVIDRTNVAGSVIIEGNATNSWASPSYGATVAVGQDGLDGRYKLYHDVVATWVTGYRYCRIRPAGTATNYGGTVWEVGSVGFAGTVTAWSVNMGFPYRRTFLRATDDGQRVGGGAEPSALGNNYCRLTLSTNTMPSADMQTTMDGLIRAGRHQPLLFFPNQGSTAEVYICHRVAEVGVDVNGVGAIEIAAIALEEYV